MMWSLPSLLMKQSYPVRSWLSYNQPLCDPKWYASLPHSVREWAELVQNKPTVNRYQDITGPTLLLSGTEAENHPSFATKAG